MNFYYYFCSVVNHIYERFVNYLSNFSLINIMEDRFINPYTDYGFKKLFGTEQNADLLTSFLNALIAGDDQPSDPIVSITYKNVEHIGEINTMRSSYFDVFCQTQSGTDFIVEMQNGKQIYFKDRSLYYATIPIQDQGKKGKAKAEAEALALEKELARKGDQAPMAKKPAKGWNYHLKDVYLVAILDFNFPGGEYADDDYFHEIKLMDVKDKHVFYDKLTLIYLEMPKLEKREFKLETMRDKWMYALYSLCYTDVQPEELQEEVFLKLFREAEVARFNETQILSYRESLRDLWDCYSTWECASQEGIEIGVAKGKELGLAEGKELGLAEANLENARKMKALGIDDETIAKVTGLKPEEFQTLER